MNEQPIADLKATYAGYTLSEFRGNPVTRVNRSEGGPVGSSAPHLVRRLCDLTLTFRRLAR
jgi:hypothetical protein